MPSPSSLLNVVHPEADDPMRIEVLSERSESKELSSSESRNLCSCANFTGMPNSNLLASTAPSSPYGKNFSNASMPKSGEQNVNMVLRRLPDGPSNLKIPRGKIALLRGLFTRSRKLNICAFSKLGLAYRVPRRKASGKESGGSLRGLRAGPASFPGLFFPPLVPPHISQVIRTNLSLDARNLKKRLNDRSRFV